MANIDNASLSDERGWTRDVSAASAGSSKILMIKFKEGADVAQLVEQSIRNRQVIGSSPIVGSILFRENRSRFRIKPAASRLLAHRARRASRPRP